MLPTGETIAERRRDTPGVEQTAARVDQVLDEAPGLSGRGLIGVIEPENPGLVAATLSALRAIGRAVVTVDDRWFAAGAVMGGR